MHKHKIIKTVFLACLMAFLMVGFSSRTGETFASRDPMRGGSGEQLMISDERFIMGSQLPLHLATFLSERSEHLSAVPLGTCDGKPWTLSDQLEFLGHLTTVDPRVILTVLELKRGLLTNPDPTEADLRWAMGYQDARYAGLAKQIELAAQELSAGFYAYYSGETDLEIVFADGSRQQASRDINAGTYALQRFLALGSLQEEWRHLIGRGPGSFYETYQRFFGDPLDGQVQVASPQGFPTDMELRLPWRMGESWYFSSGPHRTNPSDSVLGAVDWAPGDGWCSPTNNRTSSSPVLAARGGRVVFARCNLVKVDHGSNWSTAYFHLDNIRVSEGQTVSVGSVLGYPSCLVGKSCGWNGSANGPHVHFDIRYGDVRQPIDGTIISGWRINAGSLERAGTMTRGNQTVQLNQRVPSDNSSDPDDARTISAGQTLNGQISPGGDQDLYYFDGTANQEITIEMTKSSGNLDPYIILNRPNGSNLGYNDDGAGYPNARLIIRLPDSGRYQIVARSYASSETGAYTLRVTAGSGGRDTDDGRWLVHDRWLSGSINPNNDEDWYYFSGVEGRIVSIRMNKSGGNLDSYLELYAPNGSRIAYDDDGGGWDTRNAWLVTVLPNTGIYRVKARSYAHSSSGAYAIRLRMVDANNYALNQSAWASSVESNIYAPFRAVDGRLDTRWSSRFSDPQWIYIDLGQNRTFDTVILRWETAYARRYGIYVGTGNDWHRVFWTDNGRGGTVIIRFPMTTARYVLMYGIQRGTPSGYSLGEFGVYNSTQATVPIVPPEDPDKDPDTVEPLPPLPLPEEEEGKEILALYLGDGENAQEVVPLPGEDPGLVPDTTVGNEGHPIASIEAIYPASDWVIRPDDVVEFYGSATDNDAAGDPGIVAYEWQSNRDGLLSTQQNFTLMGSALSGGEHIISFRAQDNEGNWSEWNQVTIQVQGYRIMLPIVVR